jgi:hypothetical protein
MRLRMHSIQLQSHTHTCCCTIHTFCCHYHNSYWPEYGGNANPIKRLPNGKPTFIEFTHRLIDWLHAYRIPHDQSKPSKYRNSYVKPMLNFVRQASSIHYYESLVIIEKSKHLAKTPARLKGGNHKLAIKRLPFNGTYFEFSVLKKSAPELFSDF